jgi:hypothetical protein
LPVVRNSGESSENATTSTASATPPAAGRAAPAREPPRTARYARIAASFTGWQDEAADASTSALADATGTSA